MIKISLIEKLFNREPSRSTDLEAISEPFYPFRVRYALQYRPRRFFTREIKLLLGEDFVDVALYLTLKAMDDYIALQTEFISDVGNAILDRESIGGVINEYVDYLGEKTVNATKLAQISRIGPRKIQDMFEEGSKRLYEEEKTPVLIGYSANLGYRKFVEHLPRNHHMMMVVSHHLDNPEFTGYLVKKNNSHVKTELVTPYSKLPELNPIVFVDETVRRGDTLTDIITFWHENNWPEISEARTIVNRNGLNYTEDIPIYPL